MADIYVYDGEVSSGIVLTDGDYMHVSYGGVASDTVLDGGYMSIESGGTAYDISFSSYSQLSLDGGSASGVYMNSDGGSGNIGLSWDAKIEKVELHNGCMELWLGAVASDVSVGYNASMCVGADGSARKVTVNDWGYVSVYNGGVVAELTVESGGHVYVESGGVISGALFNDGGYWTLYNGASAVDVVINEGAHVDVVEGAYVSSAVINSGGGMEIVSGGSVNGAVINGGGRLYISSGGTATNVDWTPCAGTLTVESGAVVTYKNTHSGVYVGSGGQLVEHSLSVSYWSGGGWYNSTFDTMYVMSHGSAYYTYVTYGAVMYVSRGGQVENTFISSGGTVYVNSSGCGYNFHVESTGMLVVSSGGTATAIRESGGWVEVQSGAKVEFASNTLYNFSCSDKATVHSNTVVEGGKVTYGGEVHVFEGGIVNNLQVESAGKMIISSGGTATQVVENGGYVEVADGAVADFAANTFGNITLTSSATVHKNTVAENITVMDSGYLYIYSGGSATGIVENGGYVEVADGAIVDFVANTFSGQICEEATIHSNTVASNVTVYGGIVHVFDGGLMDNASIFSSYRSVYDEFGNWVGNEIVFGAAYVYNGGSANDITVNTDGRLLISSGGSANDITVNTDGRMVISSGGTATAIKENGGYVEVYEGANVTFASNTISGHIIRNEITLHSNTVASDVTVYGGTVHIFDGGLMDKAFTYGYGYGGTVYVYNGGSANDITVNSDGRMVISSGGTATAIKENGGYVEVADGAVVEFAANTISGNIRNEITLHSNTVASGVYICGGVVHVFDGGLIDNASIVGDYRNVFDEFGNWVGDEWLAGSAYVYNGGSANAVTVNSGGRMVISSGGTATAIKENGGYVEVYEGANVTFASNTISGEIYNEITLHSNTVASDVTVYGTAYVFDGGLVDKATVSYERVPKYDESGNVVEEVLRAGTIYVYDGGRTNEVEVSWSSYMHISGGRADNTVVYGGAMYVEQDGCVNNTKLDYYGDLHILSGGTASSTTVTSSGFMYISSGGVADNTTMSGGNMYISSGGVAGNTVMKGSWCKVYVRGGKAEHTTINAGSMHISAGGTASNTTMTGGVMDVFSGGVADNTTMSGGGMYISSGGTANSTTMTGGGMYLSSGGLADNTTMSGGNMHISSGGLADNTTMKGGGMYISSDGLADNTVMNGGYMHISSGGLADNTVMNGGYMYISGGASATGIVENGGYVSVAEGAVVEFASHTVSGLTLNTSMTVHSNTVAQDITIAAAGVMYIYDGGIANDAIINSAGVMYISSGGTVENTTVNHKGSMIFSSGASATGIVENGGYVSVDEGAVVTFASNSVCGLTIKTSMTVHSNTVAQDIAVSAAGKMYIYDGGIAENTVLQGSATSKYYNSWTYHYAEMYLSGGSASNTTVSSYANLYISSGGIAENTIVNSSGFMYISSGGVADNATIYSAGSVCIYSGGIADNLYVLSGGRVSLQGGTVRNLEFAANQNVVWSGNVGSVEGMIVNSNVFIKAHDANFTGMEVCEMGAVYVSGGVVMQSEVDGWGILQLCSGAVASNTVVHTGGHCYIGSGAVVTGEFTVETGATVLAFTGSELNLNLEARSADSEALVNDLSSIVGNISYSITISADQNAGLYRLADNVLTFTNDVQLFWGDEVFEGFNVGETLECNGISLELILEDNSLMLEVSSPGLYLNADSGAGGLPDWTDPLAAGTDLESGGNTMNDPLKDGILA